MTDIDDLVERLEKHAKEGRDRPNNFPPYYRETDEDKAAQALTAQRDRIAGLERVNQDWLEANKVLREDRDERIADKANLEAHNAMLAGALGDLHKAFILRHGCFPIDKNNSNQKQWCTAMNKSDEALNATPEQIKAAAEVLAGVDTMVNDHECDEVIHPLCWERVLKAVRRMRGE